MPTVANVSTDTTTNGITSLTGIALDAVIISTSPSYEIPCSANAACDP